VRTFDRLLRRAHAGALSLWLAALASGYPASGGGNATASGPTSYGGTYTDTVTWSISPGSLNGSLRAYNYTVNGSLTQTNGNNFMGGSLLVVSIGSVSVPGPSGTFNVPEGTDFTVTAYFNPGFTYEDVLPTATSLSPLSEWRKTFTAGSPPPPPTFKVTVSLFNDRTVPARYKLLQGSTVLGEVTLQPGTGLIQTFETTSSETVSILEEIDDLTKDGTTWVVLPGATTTRIVQEGVAPQAPPENSPPSWTPEPVVVTQAADVPESPTPSPTPGRQPVWTNQPANNNPTQQTDLLTNKIYREGVDKVVTTLDSLKENSAKLQDRLDTGDTYTPTSDLATGATKAAQAVQYSGPSVTGNGATVSTPNVPAPQFPTWTVGNREITLSLFPETGGIWTSADALLVACRTLILIALAVFSVRSCNVVLQTYVASLMLVPQADSNVGIENMAPGIAQGKTWGAAAIIVGIVVVAVAGAVVWINLVVTSNSALSIGSLLGGYSFTEVGYALTLLDRYLPIAAFVQFSVLRAAFGYFIAPVYLAAAAAIKFAKA